MGGTHEAQWPDKAVFASIMLLVAGILGTFFALIQPVVSLGDSIPGLLKAFPWWLALPLSIATGVMGYLALKTHTAAWTYAGSATGILSMGFVGLVPVLSLAALGFMLRSYQEGELTRGDAPPLEPGEWPDKALSASLLLFVAGVLTVFQAAALYADRFDAMLFDDLPWIWGTVSLLAGAFCLFAAREVFYLRRPWAGTAAVVVGVLAFGLYVIGPILALAAWVLLMLAHREQEFDLPAANA
ncbi:MAG: hypothetical protein ACPGQL_09260 [Thermoplasmatota archaeon]